MDVYDSAGVAHGAAEIAVAVLDGAADLGDDMLAGRRTPGPLLFALWIVAAVDAAALWFRFAGLFDSAPGWAVLAGGVYGLLAIGLLGLTMSNVRRHLRRPPS